MAINTDRRIFLRNAAITFAMASLYPALSFSSSKGTLSLAAAGYRNPRMQALFDGKLPVDGCKVKFEEAGVGDVNTDMFSGSQTWDFAEVGLHPFMLAYAKCRI